MAQKPKGGGHFILFDGRSARNNDVPTKRLDHGDKQLRLFTYVIAKAMDKTIKIFRSAGSSKLKVNLFILPIAKLMS
jgi:hypothetical protein